MLDLVDKALRFAAKAHKQQVRKNDKETPYVYHTAMTGYYLMQYGIEEEVVAAAICHDTVEDTHIELEDVERELGTRVAELVKYCTEDKSLSWEDRKRSQLDGIRKYPIEVLLLKLADKLHNITDTYNDIQVRGNQVFEQFNRGKDKQVWYYQGLVEAFETRDEIKSHPMFLEFKEKVSFVFG